QSLVSAIGPRACLLGHAPSLRGRILQLASMQTYRRVCRVEPLQLFLFQACFPSFTWTRLFAINCKLHARKAPFFEAALRTAGMSRSSLRPFEYLRRKALTFCIGSVVFTVSWHCTSSTMEAEVLGGHSTRIILVTSSELSMGLACSPRHCRRVYVYR